MIRIAALLSILLTTSANSECWIVTNLHGYGAMNGDRYEFTKDSTEDSVFHVTINGDKSSKANVPSMNTPLSYPTDSVSIIEYSN